MSDPTPTQSQEAAPRRLIYSEIHAAILAEPKRIRQQFVFAEDYDIAIRERDEARQRERTSEEEALIEKGLLCLKAGISKANKWAGVLRCAEALAASRHTKEEGSREL